MTVRTLTIAPGEVLAWHYHPGYAYNVVRSGTLTVEDGCGGEETLAPGQAFEEMDGRVHRAKNLSPTVFGIGVGEKPAISLLFMDGDGRAQASDSLTHTRIQCEESKQGVAVFDAGNYQEAIAHFEKARPFVPRFRLLGHEGSG